MTEHTRKVIGNIALSLDGRINGRGGDYDMSWILPHAVTDTTRDYLVQMTHNATTALLGRKNYEGFGGYWPAIANDDTAEPRDRAFVRWLESVEKVVVSRTLQETRPGKTPGSPATWSPRSSSCAQRPAATSSQCQAAASSAPCSRQTSWTA